jgi:hypothetical protein
LLELQVAKQTLVFTRATGVFEIFTKNKSEDFWVKQRKCKIILEGLSKKGSLKLPFLLL